ncbi:hypothetical protein GCM10007424_06750 [Flavobacterium suaedae]|uniref:Glycosyl-4,4'-diaponeurosporenoate acyltransferase n=1 Tax=Flavobacterium suaedae TaxID=1767027 RepID=A0ABQ1JIP3_9FLAO|nr:hypothetical protein [Flavobacterium suaedae]GGB69411.1 hypothetical protein GCM10007424_06750 [Flavobacterium suaedae]
MIKYITFGIAISFISWLVGMFFNVVLAKTRYYEKLSNLNILKSKSLNRNIGVGVIKWYILNTPFKYFNQKLKVDGKAGVSQLNELRKEMTYAELGYLIGFIFVSVFIVVNLVKANYLAALIIMIINILMNLYPSLLQQQNKRRIDRLIKIAEFKNKR